MFGFINSSDYQKSDYEVGLLVLKEYVRKFNEKHRSNLTLEDMIANYPKHQIEGLGLGLKIAPEIKTYTIQKAIQKVVDASREAMIPDSMIVFGNYIVEVHRNQNPFLSVSFYKSVGADLAEKTADITNKTGTVLSSSVNLYEFFDKNKKWMIPVASAVALLAVGGYFSSKAKGLVAVTGREVRRTVKTRRPQ